MDTRDLLYMKELQPLHLETVSRTTTNLQPCLLRSPSESINICLSEMPTPSKLDCNESPQNVPGVYSAKSGPPKKAKNSLTL